MRKILLPVLGAAVLAALLLCLGASGRSVTTGRCLVASNGTYLIVLDDGSPVVMHDRSKGGRLFDALSSGDRIRITHDAINESYPGQTGVYRCTRLSSGSLEDLPADTLTQLQELNWRPKT